jgi:hypothetical protein
MTMRAISASAFIAAVALAGLVQAADSPSALAFRVDEGRNINSFVRTGPVSAHLVLRAGTAPRLLIAFPAGNSGVALWFTPTDQPVNWTLVDEPRGIQILDAKGRALHGIEVNVVADAPTLRVQRALLSSVRVLRDYEAGATVPHEISVSPTRQGNGLTWSRDRLDGKPGYTLSVQPLNAATISTDAIAARPGTRLQLKIIGATGEVPLTPLDTSSVLTRAAVGDARTKNILTFLAYREKFLAGSWRFDTYFGRDTLMTLALLMPVMQPDAVESGLAAVLDRLAPNGEVAHEEDIGEFAVLRNDAAGRGRTDTPLFDYGMVDDDFMLAPVAAAWLLDNREGQKRARDFLGAPHANGRRAGDALAGNFRWVIERSADFARRPTAENLVGIHAGRTSGQWRDSDAGLGGGRYPYDVNVVFVPAALHAIDRLVRSGLLDPYVSLEDREILLQARARYEVWSEAASSFFSVTLPPDRVRADVLAYSTEAEVDPGLALDSLGDETLAFNAVSLDAEGRPVPVMHSDDGFLLLFGSPSPAALERSIKALLRPFPAGLWTPVGVLVANPAFASRDIRTVFTRAAYHGTVVWSWQQAVLAAGLNRQLTRTDLPPNLRRRLEEARSLVWSAIEGGSRLRTSELWSWSFADGCYRAESFGSGDLHVDESNAAQLWSTVFLALTPRRAFHRAIDTRRFPSLCTGPASSRVR